VTSVRSGLSGNWAASWQFLALTPAFLGVTQLLCHFSEVHMPRYEFYCEDCKKPFEIILTLAEYEKGHIKCPKCGSREVHQEAAAFFAVTSKKS
jgi:putative FmdB family regulatory protein